MRISEPQKTKLTLHYSDNKMGDTGLGIAEVDTAPGDSGGPSFIDGRVAAVTSGGTDLRSRFGESSTNDRVSAVAGWLDSNFLRSPRDIVLDMRWQQGNNDGVADRIEVSRGGTNVEIVVNGTVHREVLSNVRSLTIRGSNDADTIVLGAGMEYPGFNLTIDGQGGRNAVQGPNRWNVWEMTGGNAGRLNYGHVFTSIQNLTGGNSGDEFRIVPGGYLSGRLDGGVGIYPNTLNYSSFTTTVRVDLAAGTASSVYGGIAAIDNVWGGSAVDYLYGNDLANVLMGNGGGD